MRLKIILIYIVFTVRLSAQISIGSGDFAKSGDQVRFSISSDKINYELTGANYVWNFGNLKVTNQDILKYVSPLTTPYILQFFGATYGIEETNFPLGPLGGNAASDIFSFYKLNSQSLLVLGRGATVQSLPLGINYSLKDTIMKFPMTFGKSFSGSYLGEASLPSVGSLKQSGTRNTVVDGWGKITTPFGTFDCLRIKSIVLGTDSIVFGGFGIPIPATRTEYSWIAKNQDFPILEVVVNNLTNTVTSFRYKDIFRPEAYINNCNFSASKLAGKIGDTITLNNISYGTPKSFKWEISPNTYEFAPGFSSTSENPKLVFTALGNYSIKLNVSYEGASDDTIKVDYIKIRNAAIADFYSKNLLPKTNEIVALRDTSTGTIISWQWTITPSTGVQYKNGTSNISQHPQVQFNELGNYSVQLRATNAIGSNTIKKVNYFQVWPTGIDNQISNQEIKFFPNPGKDFIEVESNKIGPIDITIYNIFGQIVFNKTLANQGERRIQVQNLPRGIYYLELVQTEQKIVNRLILE